MDLSKARCLILACGNTLRGDDGVGPFLAQWAEERFGDNPGVRIIARQQWTPDLAAEIAAAETVVFIDCSIESEAGQILLREVAAAPPDPGVATHHTGAPELLGLAYDLYEAAPRKSALLTIGAGSVELGEKFSPAIRDSLPQACRLLEQTVRDAIAS